MSKYSPDGYLIALRERGCRTLIVEGVPDRMFALHLLAETPAAHAPPVVDLAAIVEGSGGLGARELIEEIHTRASTFCPGQLAGLVDREFRDFACEPPVSDQLQCHRVASGTLFWTRGHSVENYCFTVGSIWAFIRLQYPAFATQAIRQALESAFEQLVWGAAAAGTAAHAAHVLKKCAGMAFLRMWRRSADQTLTLDFAMIGAELARRGATDDETAVFEAKALDLRAALEGPGNHQLCRWLAHGRIGSQIIWAGIAKIVEEHQGEAEAVRQLAFGFTELKFSAGVIHWASQQLALGVPIDGGEAPRELVAWIGS